MDGNRGAGAGEEMRGPHAALAARLAQRDPGRSFVLGTPATAGWHTVFGIGADVRSDTHNLRQNLIVDPDLLIWCAKLTAIVF